jgi:hypothetical protein
MLLLLLRFCLVEIFIVVDYRSPPTSVLTGPALALRPIAADTLSSESVVCFTHLPIAHISLNAVDHSAMSVVRLITGSLFVGLAGCAELFGVRPGSQPPTPPANPAVTNVERAAPPREEFVHPTSDVAKEIAALVAAGFVAGPPLSRSLAAFEPIPVPQQNHMMYVIVVRLQPEAAWSPEVQAAGIRPTFGHDRSCTPGVVDGGLVVARCESIDRMTIKAGTDETMTLQLANQPPFRFVKVPELGRGDALAYVYTRPATKADQRRWDEQTQAFINDNSPAANGARACQECRATFEDCRRSAGQGNCIRAYANCLPEAVDRNISTWQLCGQPAP